MRTALWLGRAHAHWMRDTKRSHESLSVSRYKELIHGAVCDQQARDYYTNARLAPPLHLRQRACKRGRHGYKKGLDRLPSVDHESADATSATFRICGWATNDAKHALSTEEFIALARKVLEHAGRKVEEPA